ncbi:MULTISPECIES: TetR/AcrR family transcriptional regulator [Bacillus cereus group]|uniref:TetR/AcrR family transcriptional regulator n=1 Tax=Bacillus cereus group TaxID=86661 RepID=UPI000BF3AB15|nr:MULTISPECIES: TetR/AcrR family transcriptional regulator [Bacillus cereus group]EKS7857844.1 TetR/AcrR family transcriptional regulator [Bacillus cereus]MBE4942204.1 TetR/AcrR family transcriptional regulator [Bacillus thuringiensis]MCC2386527.1 TetR/AcrR family transcriptional regulator [Bacillus cereus]MDF9536465.1 TetR/AcrR family transcriptional regulator [Bacillus cereus]MDF9536485.1 TetR/AcrR family transcriptional regulator [Bacillus cereus]
MNEMTNTSERIIEAFLELFRTYGYKGTTTRSIAELAGVNEVTIFRNFGSKKKIMEKSVEFLSRNIVLKKLMHEEMTWNLEHDLLLIAEGYHRYIEKMKDLILISFREAGMFPELNETIALIPKQLKDDLVSYFIEMNKRGRLIETDMEAQAMNFIWMNFGYFLSNSRFSDNVFSNSKENFLKHSIQLFSRGLTP